MDKTEEDENGLHLGKLEKDWFDLFAGFSHFHMYTAGKSCVMWL